MADVHQPAPKYRRGSAEHRLHCRMVGRRGGVKSGVQRSARSDRRESPRSRRNRAPALAFRRWVKGCARQYAAHRRLTRILGEKHQGSPQLSLIFPQPSHTLPIGNPLPNKSTARAAGVTFARIRSHLRAAVWRALPSGGALPSRTRLAEHAARIGTLLLQRALTRPEVDAVAALVRDVVGWWRRATYRGPVAVWGRPALPDTPQLARLVELAREFLRTTTRTFDSIRQTALFFGATLDADEDDGVLYDVIALARG